MSAVSCPYVGLQSHWPKRLERRSFLQANLMSQADPSMSNNEGIHNHPIDDTRSKHLASDESMTVSRALPLLICSIGNPGSLYANTLHCAGHTVLQRLASELNATQFTKSRQYGNGLLTQVETSTAAPWTLWQSTSYMNESGRGVQAAYRDWSRHLDGDGKLVIVYDELEKSLGSVTLKTDASASAKGHNGLKSIKSVLGNTSFARIGVGIGRPVSREPDDVSKYVLRKMLPNEKEEILAAVPEVIAKLEQLSNAG